MTNKIQQIRYENQSHPSQEKCFVYLLNSIQYRIRSFLRTWFCSSISRSICNILLWFLIFTWCYFVTWFIILIYSITIYRSILIIFFVRWVFSFLFSHHFFINLCFYIFVYLLNDFFPLLQNIIYTFFIERKFYFLLF